MAARLAGCLAVVLALLGASIACGGDAGLPPPTPTLTPAPSPQPDAANDLPDLLPEPLPGLFAFGEAELQLSHDEYVVGINPLIAWAALEPREGEYDWDKLDDAIAAAESAGSTIVPRILTNANFHGQPTPDWFFEIEDARYYYPSAEAEAQGFKAPVTWDPVFQAKFGRFLRALGQRYNGDPAIEYFQTNAGGGLYGEIVVARDYTRFPEGWEPELQREYIVFWLDRWLEAFPDTPLSLMVNHVGDRIGEDVAAYAARLGVYLQQNTPWLPPEAVDIFLDHQDSTKIILEAEDGCNSTGEGEFERLMDTVLAYGFAIDYLHLCAQSFIDPVTAARLPSISLHLR